MLAQAVKLYTKFNQPHLCVYLIIFVLVPCASIYRVPCVLITKNWSVCQSLDGWSHPLSKWTQPAATAFTYAQNNRFTGRHSPGLGTTPGFAKMCVVDAQSKTLLLPKFQQYCDGLIQVSSMKHNQCFACVCCGRCIGRLSRCYWNGVNITLWGLSLSVLRKPCHGKLFLNVLSWVICLIQISEEVWSMTLTPMLYHWHHSKDGEWAACQAVLHSWVASTMLLYCHRSGRNKTRKSFLFLQGSITLLSTGRCAGLSK